ncbi:MAG: hypothetical protein RMX96_14895 [Nostoc sp. ChiSLP02]|nr:hypothetical protein [Nostoc sp. DedSLP05]MDZ8099617.1 hypothetical protein [Nostoc sp. DedSLP01]MDZ8186127.1 hypothetical protein [Nostoc sp. ChiSLP02]
MKINITNLEQNLSLLGCDRSYPGKDISNYAYFCCLRVKGFARLKRVMANASDRLEINLSLV